MGVPEGEATGDHILTLRCKECGTDYETDETMLNDCPECNFQSFEIRD